MNRGAYAVVAMILGACVSEAPRAPASAPVSSLQCREIFSRAPDFATLQMATHLAQEVNWEDWTVRAAETRVSAPSAQGDALFVRQTQFKSELNSGEHVASVFSFTRHAGSASQNYAPSAKLIEDGRATFRNACNRALKLVLDFYVQRRPNWPPSFIAKLKKLAEEWELESTYVNIEARAWDDDSSNELKLLASIRLIHERGGRVPMEDFLGLRIANPDGSMKVEPGNFGMLHEGNEISSVEFAILLIGQMKRYRAEFGKEAYFVTYGDDFSQRMYKMMGFKPVPPAKVQAEESSKLKIDPVKQTVLVEKEGVDWMPLYADESMLRAHLESRLARLARKPGQEALLAHLVEAVSRSEEAAQAPPEVFNGRGQSFNHASGQPLSPNARLYVLRAQKDRAQIYLQLGYERLFRANPFFSVPRPLRDGWSDSPRPGVKIDYHAGVLRYAETFAHDGQLEVVVQEIGIDANLERPQWARLQSRSGNAMMTEIRMFF